MENSVKINEYNNAKVIFYNPPGKALPSPDYRLKINGEEIFVYHTPGFAGGAISYASFDFSGEITIEVISRWNVETVSIHPLSKKISCDLINNTAKFMLKEPQNLYIKFNDTFELPFYLFANPIETTIYSAENKDVLYFGPGIHNPGIIEVKSNETVYIAGGAIVNGTILCSNAENVKIKGRGILSTSHLEFGYSTDKCKDVIGIEKCKNVMVEGIIILDSFAWTLVTYNCDNVDILNVKILNERKWSTDGINPCNCRDVRIKGCFIRCKDDCISVKGLDWEDDNGRPRSNWALIKNNVIKNCVFWSDNNNSVVVGAETRAEVIENIKFINCDIIKSSNTCGDIAGAMSIVCLDDTHIENIVFENIRIEYANGPLFNFFYTESMFSGQIPGTKKIEGGIIKNVICKDIKVTGGPFRKSYITGIDDKHIISDVSFENINILGTQVRSADEGKIIINSFTSSIKFLD